MRVIAEMLAEINTEINAVTLGISIDVRGQHCPTRKLLLLP